MLIQLSYVAILEIPAGIDPAVVGLEDQPTSHRRDHVCGPQPQNRTARSGFVVQTTESTVPGIGAAQGFRAPLTSLKDWLSH